MKAPSRNGGSLVQATPKSQGIGPRDSRLPRYPTYNHTREDSALTPCPECKELQRGRVR